MTKSLAELLKSQVVFGDGAMGTMLYSKGVFINTCFEELNLTNPQLVGQIHDLYVAAGSDFIENQYLRRKRAAPCKIRLGRKNSAD
jgi:homocysteine S-methyltransferase